MFINDFIYPTAPIFSGDDEWVQNGYQSLTTFENLTYDKFDSNLANKVFAEPGIYTFYLEDLAGHTFQYTIVLDDTNPYIIQTPPSISQNNIVPVETTLTWGTHKAIEVSDISLLADVIASNILFAEDNGTTYIIIPIEQVDIYSAGLSEEDLLVTKNDNQLYDSFIKDDAEWATSIIFYPFDGEGNKQEAVYDTYAVDFSSLTDITTLTYKNETRLRLRMNLDRSQGSALTLGVIIDNLDTDNTLRFLAFDQASNRQLLKFSYLDAIDKYQIDSLNYTFYPLVFDDTQDNYPYSDTPSLTNIDLIAGSNTVEGVEYTDYINTIYSAYYNADITLPGKYIITRTYVGEEVLFDGTGDAKVKLYTYYIDRNPVIDQTDYLVTGTTDEYVFVGDNIQIELGETAGRTPVLFNGQSFLIDVSTKAEQTLFESNLLPVRIQLPQNKYSLLNTGQFETGLGGYNLLIKIN